MKKIFLVIVAAVMLLSFQNVPTSKPFVSITDNTSSHPIFINICTEVPVLLYHHIQPLALSRAKEQEGLTVDPLYLREHILYLQSHGYKIVTVQQLKDFFDQGKELPLKPILLTFDDAYKDFYINAFPILKEYNTPAVLFLPPGLIDSYGYMNWNEVEEVSNSGHVYIANHTWSHASMQIKKDNVENEIISAHEVLSKKGLNNLNVFAYPYGAVSYISKDILSRLNYSLGFTTTHGRVLCKVNRLTLPRIHAVNASLKSLGL